MRRTSFISIMKTFPPFVRSIVRAGRTLPALPLPTFPKQRGNPITEHHRLSWGARFLLVFCRSPGSPDYSMSGIHYDPGNELDVFQEVFPNLRREIAGKCVIDFGSGLGYQSMALAVAGARRVVGIEIDEQRIEIGRARITEQGLARKVCFERKIPNGLRADVILSQNSFEHFLDSKRILAEMSAALAPGGKIYITFAPPWNAPWGAHMAFFCRLPWVHLFFPERTIMEVRSLFRPGTERTYREVGLAQMSLAQFERTVKSSGLQIQFRRYDCIRGMNALQWTPLRELFVNRVSCVLRAPQN